jgi:hypothetical protein
MSSKHSLLCLSQKYTTLKTVQIAYLIVISNNWSSRKIDKDQNLIYKLAIIISDYQKDFGVFY